MRRWAPTTPSPRSKTPPTRSPRPTSASPIPATARPMRCSRSRSRTLPAAGTLALSGVAVTAGQFVSAANITAGNLKFTPAANANGAAYASLHLPGAGRRRHGQRRRRSRYVGPHDDGQRHRGQRRAGGHQQHRHHARRHGLHLHRGRLRLHRSEPTARPTRNRCAVKITHAARGGHADAVRRGRHRRPKFVGSQHHCGQSQVHARRPTPTARPTPPSPSRCRTTAAPPTAASISIPRRAP